MFLLLFSGPELLAMPLEEWTFFISKVRHENPVLFSDFGTRFIKTEAAVPLALVQDGAPKIAFSCIKKVAEFYGLW